MILVDQDRKDLQDFIAGKPQGAKSLIARYASPLINQASYLLGGDRAMAEDVVQMSFLKLWENASKLLASDKELQLRAWLFRVTRNQALDELRKNKAVISDQFDHIQDGEPTRQQILEHEERAKYAMDLIHALPERQKSALLMAHFEGMGNAEIAQVLDCTIEAVENLLARARRALRQRVLKEEVMI